VIRLAAGCALLAFQLGAVVYARFVDSRYFCWAPYDTQTDYAIEAAAGGRPLTAEEIRARYRRPAKGTDNRSPRHVQDILSGVETRYRADDPTEIVMRYRVNGGAEQVWRWPE
jgi:hypothetical protein